MEHTSMTAYQSAKKWLWVWSGVALAYALVDVNLVGAAGVVGEALATVADKTIMPILVSGILAYFLYQTTVGWLATLQEAEVTPLPASRFDHRTASVVGLLALYAIATRALAPAATMWFAAIGLPFTLTVSLFVVVVLLLAGREAERWLMRRLRFYAHTRAWVHILRTLLAAVVFAAVSDRSLDGLEATTPKWALVCWMVCAASFFGPSPILSVYLLEWLGREEDRQ